jgi:hypothetical protein
MNNTMALWTEIFYHGLDGKPYQPAIFMVAVHSLFGELSRVWLQHEPDKYSRRTENQKSGPLTIDEDGHD